MHRRLEPKRHRWRRVFTCVSAFVCSLTLEVGSFKSDGMTMAKMSRSRLVCDRAYGKNFVHEVGFSYGSIDYLIVPVSIYAVMLIQIDYCVTQPKNECATHSAADNGQGVLRYNLDRRY